MAPTTGDGKKADPEVQQEVDIWILDYVLFQAIKALFDERNAERDEVPLPESANPDLPLGMVDAFLFHFNKSHSPDAVPSALRSRLRLLQFVSLFTRRLRPSTSSPTSASLGDLRSKNGARAQWRKNHLPSDFDENPRIWEPFPLSEQRLAHNRQYILKTLKAGDGASADYYGSPSVMAIFDLLPLFMSLSAHLYKERGWEVKEQWLELAGEFMLQAALEQYLLQGADGTDVLRACFSFGWDSRSGKDRQAKYKASYPYLNEDEYKEMTDEEDMINDLFYDEVTHTEIEGWRETREKFLEFLKPEPDMNIARQLELAASQYPMLDFEGQMLMFLDALFKVQPAPVLVQLEAGQFEGMSIEETAELKAKVGLEF